MFAISTKAKVAAGVAAGALMLGAAGAYAASANNTIPVVNVMPTALPSGGPTLIAVNPKATLTLPPSFANHGACISFFATNRNFAVVPKDTKTGSTVNVSKNYHGKLISGLQSWCDSQVKATSTTTTDQTATTDTTQSNDTQSGPPQGHGHGHGHGKPAFATD